MISQTVITRADAGNTGVSARIDSYYQDKKDDYYAREDQPSMWQGQLAQELGLHGAVQRDDFVQLMEGIHNGKDLRQGKNKKHDAMDRLGIDLTFNAPKSVSIQALVGGDKRLIEAHNQAVAETLAYIEKNAQTRVKENRVSRVETTGKLAIGTFRHDTNRNNEPHLHTHSVVLNFTQREDGQYRALHNEKIIKNTKEYSAVYQTTLAKKAKELGYNIRHNPNGTFDLAHISKEQISAFSTRSRQIEEELAKNKLDRETATTAEKQQATMNTRKAKTTPDREKIQTAWLNKAEALNIKLDTAVLKPVAYRIEQNSVIEAIGKNPINHEYTFKGGKIHKNILQERELEQHLSATAQLNQTPSLSQQVTMPRETAVSIESPTKFNQEEKYNDQYDKQFTTERESRSGGVVGTWQPDEHGELRLSFARPDRPDEITQEEVSGRETAEQPPYRDDTSYTDYAGLHRHVGRGIQQDGAGGGGFNAREGNSLSGVSSVFVATGQGQPTLFLPNHENDQLVNPRADDISRLRWSDGSLSTTGRAVITIEAFEFTELQIDNPIEPEKPKQDESEKETVNDILRFELPDEALIERWKNLTQGIDFSVGHDVVEQDDTELELVHHVIAHVTERKVETSERELTQQLLVKGLGSLDAGRVEGLIHEAIERGDLIYAQSRYKYADERDESKALNHEQWVKKVQSESGDMTEAEATQAVNNSIENGRMVETEKLYTTNKHLQRERAIVESLHDEPQARFIVLPKRELQEQLAESTLNPEQKNAVGLILSTPDRIVGVQGFAGVGKSYTLKTAIDMAQNEQHRKEVVLLAPYSKQVAELRKDGLEAQTLASFLKSKTKQAELGENSIVVVDESGVVNTQQMHQLVAMTKEKNIKLVLLGDIAQTKAIEAGSPFKLMQEQGMPTAKMQDIQRQKDVELKAAVVEAAHHRPEESLQYLKHIVEEKDKIVRHTMIAKQYTDLSESERGKTIVVSGTNADRADINERVRENLGLVGQGREVVRLKPTALTKEEMRMPRNFQEGQVINFNLKQKEPYFSENKGYEITKTDKNQIYVKGDDGHEYAVNPKVTTVTLYDRERIELTKNDIVRMSKSNKEEGVSTGDVFKVVRENRYNLEDNTIVLENEKGDRKRINAKEDLHLDYAYATTVHASQGVTVDRVIVNLDTKSQTTNKDVFYVAVSRAKHEAHIYTDNMNDLPHAIRKESNKLNAINIVETNRNHKENYKKDQKIQMDIRKPLNNENFSLGD
jgi:conjugative relaxase-like TrwC/TraI family protein